MKRVEGLIGDELTKSDLVVLEVGGKSCAACSAFYKTLSSLESSFSDVSFLYADVEEVEDIGIFGVMSLPTTFLIADAYVVDTVIGAVSKHVMEEKIKALFRV